MFEQAILDRAPIRPWAVTLGFAGQLAAAACLLAMPLMGPQLLPRPESTAWLLAPPPSLSPAPRARALRTRPLRPWAPTHPFYAPTDGSSAPPKIEDAPAEIGEIPGISGGSQPVTGLTSLLTSVVDLVVPRKAEPAPAAAQPAAAEPARIRVSGSVQAARLLHRVEPVYPILARQARIEGAVELTGVIGTDGRIRELRVLRGQPFLVKAAVDAVREWVYQPTLLGARPVEVITTITVVFRLRM